MKKAPAEAVKIAGRVAPKELPAQALEKVRDKRPLTPQEKDALLMWLTDLHK